MLSAAAVVITSAMIVGQTQPTDQIKALGWMVGDWKAVDERMALLRVLTARKFNRCW
jgi:hypothetical protein